MTELVDLAKNLLGWLILAVPGAVVFHALWRRGPVSRRLFLLPRRWQAHWNGLQVVACFIALVLWPVVIAELLGTRDRQAADGPLPLDLRTAVLAFPFQLASFFLLLGQPGRPVQARALGLTWHRLRANLMAGYLVWLVVAPVVFVVYTAALWVHAFASDQRPEHPLTQVFRGRVPTPWEWSLLVFQAVVAAPVIEEVLLRGVVLRWLRNQPEGCLGVFIGALALAGVSFPKNEPLPVVLRGVLWPTVFVMVLAAVFVLAQRRGWSQDRRTPFPAVYASAVLFAAMHSGVWPSPVPLFVLGLGLGWLASRTNSLVGPILMHALFNGVACLVMAMG